MMQPPSSLPNLSLPPPGFPPFSTSSDSRQSVGGSQTAPSDANQELWVETKTGDGKVVAVLCILQLLSISVQSEIICQHSSVYFADSVY